MWLSAVMGNSRAPGSAAKTDTLSKPTCPEDGTDKRRLGLIEEAALDEACPLFRRDLNVSRRQQEHLVGHALHAPVEGVREPAREVDQTLRELLVSPLEIEDNR